MCSTPRGAGPDFRPAVSPSERWSVRLLNRRADVILCSTPPVAADFARLEQRLGLTPRPTAVVGYGLDFTEVPYSAEEPKEFDAVLLGRVHRHKGSSTSPRSGRRCDRAAPVPSCSSSVKDPTAGNFSGAVPTPDLRIQSSSPAVFRTPKRTA